MNLHRDLCHCQGVNCGIRSQCARFHQMERDAQAGDRRMVSCVETCQNHELYIPEKSQCRE